MREVDRFRDKELMKEEETDCYAISKESWGAEGGGGVKMCVHVCRK